MPDSSPFSIPLVARWSDMDFNQHMKNAAYLGASEDCRMGFLSDRGFSASWRAGASARSCSKIGSPTRRSSGSWSAFACSS
jgi:acyl-CoA thioesterase FadM